MVGRRWRGTSRYRRPGESGPYFAEFVLPFDSAGGGVAGVDLDATWFGLSCFARLSSAGWLCPVPDRLAEYAELLGFIWFERLLFAALFPFAM